MNKKMVRAVAIIITGLVLAIASVYGIVNSFTMHGDGYINMINAYSDSGCTHQVTTIHWGNLSPDSTNTTSIYIKNFGGAPITVSLSMTNWSPVDCPDYMRVTWDREAEVIAAGMALQATITMTVFANVTSSTIGAFSTDMVVTAT